MKKIFVYVSSLRLILHYLYYRTAINKDVIAKDVLRNSYQFMGGKGSTGFYSFCYLMTFYTMFRNVFYARVGKYHHFYAKFLGIFANAQPLLDISETSEIAGGLLIQHGYGTIISPAKMGRNCWINQGVSIGHRTEVGQPIIGDDVRVAAGALVLGSVKVGRGATVAPGAVVLKNVPAYAIVAGNPAQVIGFNMTPEQVIEYEMQQYPKEERFSLDKLQKNFEKYYMDRREEIAEFLK